LSVCVPRFNTLLKSLGLTGQFLNGHLFAGECGLHGVEHLHLFFFEALDTNLSLLLETESFIGLVAILMRGAHVVTVHIIALSPHHILAVIVGIRGVLALVCVILKLLLKEVVVVGLEESIQMIT